MTTQRVETLFLHYLFSLAWADGEMQGSERTFLERLVSSMGLDEGAASLVNGWFEAPPEDEANWDGLSAQYALKEGLMERALLLSGADRVVQLAEMQLLERLKFKLGFDDDAYFRIVQRVEDMWKQEA